MKKRIFIEKGNLPVPEVAAQAKNSLEPMAFKSSKASTSRLFIFF
jgi:hypothetical protein